MVKYLTSEGKTISFGDNGSYAALVSSIRNSSDGAVEEAKAYVDEKAALKEHTHVTEDVTDASTTLAAKSHTHTVSDITEGGILLRIYSGDEVGSVEMENSSSFYYLNTTSKKIMKRTKDASGDVTEEEVGALS